MRFKFPSRDDCANASAELSRYFSGNGQHYSTDIFDWIIVLHNSCPDYNKAVAICRRHGGN